MQWDVTFQPTATGNNTIRVNRVRLTGGEWQNVNMAIDMTSTATRQAGMTAILQRVDQLRAAAPARTGAVAPALNPDGLRLTVADVAENLFTGPAATPD
jgi:hypothetical protein